MATNVTDTQRRLYTYRHEQDSDEELQRFVYQTTLKIQTMSVEGIARNRVSVEELLAETAVCNEILKMRKGMHEQTEKAHADWNAALQERRYAAVINLQEAVTPNGQLIAAILEEEGALSEKEIAAWCEELSAIESSTLHEILSNLVNEEVLEVQNEKYDVRRLCTEDLFPENPAEWAIKEISNQNSLEDGEVEKAILYLMERKGTAICPEDLPEMIKKGSFAPIVRKMGYSGQTGKSMLEHIHAILKDSVMASVYFTDLVCMKVLRETVIDGVSLFYFPMLGERG